MASGEIDDGYEVVTKNKGTPRTRQSPLTLAAFRPWGSSQDGRRAGSVDESSRAIDEPARGPSPDPRFATACTR